jgi:hypothetical protein
MQEFTFHSHVNLDGVLRLEIPLELRNTELQVTVMVQPILSPKRSYSESKKRFEQMLKKYAGRTFSDSVELLREDRAR